MNNILAKHLSNFTPKTSLLGLGVFFILHTYSYGQNLIYNGDFESAYCDSRDYFRDYMSRKFISSESGWLTGFDTVTNCDTRCRYDKLHATFIIHSFSQAFTNYPTTLEGLHSQNRIVGPCNDSFV